MTIYEAIGIAWVIFTSALASVGIGYFAIKGAQVVFGKNSKDDEAVTTLALDDAVGGVQVRERRSVR